MYICKYVNRIYSDRQTYIGFHLYTICFKVGIKTFCLLTHHMTKLDDWSYIWLKCRTIEIWKPLLQMKCLLWYVSIVPFYWAINVLWPILLNCLCLRLPTEQFMVEFSSWLHEKMAANDLVVGLVNVFDTICMKYVVFYELIILIRRHAK